MSSRPWTAGIVLAFALFLSCSVFAGEVNSVPAPPDLAAWKGWVLHDAGEELCPSVYNDSDSHRCVWPSTLNISVEPTGGEFVQEWLVFTRAWAPLPGSAEIWPQGVTVDNKPAFAVDREGVASVLLAPGRHRVAGRFAWKAVPEMIKVPPESGLVGLSINGRRVENPVLDLSGNLWVERRATGKKEEDTLSVRVYRLVEDTIPMKVVTRILMEVGGSARELALPGLMLPKATPMQLESSLPARIAPDGVLSLQARPGRFTLIVTSYFKAPMKAIGPVECPNGTEIWSFSPQNDLRMVRVAGLATVDPALADAPAEWKGFPAYAVTKGQSMSFEELRRGDPTPPKNRLTLTRTLWLDFSGKGYTVHDEISGSMNRLWSLAMNPPVVLGRVTLKNSQNQENQEEGAQEGPETDLLITAQTDRKIPGVELRRGSLNLSADSRLTGSVSRLSAVGWDHDFDRVTTELRLPPGWKLLAALGPDYVSSSWLSDWNLFDFFVVLLTGIAAYRLAGGLWAGVLLLFLAISHREPGAPLFLWLFLFAPIALLKVLPEGAMRRFSEKWRKLALVILALISVGFVKEQLLYGFYPHLQNASVSSRAFSILDLLSGLPGCGGEFKMAGTVGDGPTVSSDERPVAFAPPEPADMSKSDDREMTDGTGWSGMPKKGDKAYWDRQKAQDLLNEPEALIQTGPGLPGWEFGSVQLNWTGSVERGQTLRLFLCPPWLFRILCFLRTIILVVLLAVFIAGAGWLNRFKKFAARPRGDSSDPSPNPSPNPSSAATIAVIAAFFALALFWAGGRAWATEPVEESPVQATAEAQQAADARQEAVNPLAPSNVPTPSESLLDEYRRRLLAPSDCFPSCVDCPAMELTVSPDTLLLLLEIHAAASVAVPLPGGVKSWMAVQVMVDGNIAQGLLKDKDGVLWVHLGPGVHRVALLGGIADKSAITIPLPIKPHRATVSATGWEVFGILENGSVGASIDLARIRKAGEKAAEDSGQENKLPAFLSVERVFSLSRTWTVITTISRVSPVGVAVVALVPLLPGESVTQAGIPVEKGRAVVTLNPEVEEVFFSSTLSISPRIELKAQENAPWTETWIFNVAPIWHAGFSGIPVIRHQDQGVWQPMWKPWPGERLSVSVTKPKPVAGKVLTIDRANLSWSAGERLLKGSLTVVIRSSQGGQHPLTLPSGVDLEKLTVGGQAQPVRVSGNKVLVALAPGAQQVDLEWTVSKSLGFLYRTDSVGLGSEAVNATVSVEPPHDRWILWTIGPSLGPAVLFYRYLALVLLFAFVLGRLPGTPLRTRQWILLGLGLTQASSILALAVVMWFVALRSRGMAHKAPASPSSFNRGQVFLVILTLVALGGFFDATLSGLLGIPDMAVAGNGSDQSQFNWTCDRIAGDMPRTGIIWLPMWIFRVLMLAWSLWLAFSLVGWLRWAWINFSKGGLWMHMSKASKLKTRYGDSFSGKGPHEGGNEPLGTGGGEESAMENEGPEGNQGEKEGI
ncbi:MAG: hypothetical protein HZB23_12635 [Deltaproteobacteria bacterium]|nr:hypothetical protein [Deltaproteobacteria bacterium]